MKTQDLLKIRVTSELNSAINSMKTKEHEKHARKLAKMFHLCYETALLKTASIVIKGEGSELITEFVEPVYNHFLQHTLDAFQEEDNDLLSAGTPSQDHLRDEDPTLTEEYLSMRRKRDSGVFIFAILLLVINAERTGLFQNLAGLRADIEQAKAFNKKDARVYH